MLPFILISFRHGVKWGLFTGFVNSLLQMLLGFYAPPAPGSAAAGGHDSAGLCAGLYPAGPGLRHCQAVQATAWWVWLSARRRCAASASCAASCPAC
ncbi:hypothetical protein [Gemmiger formicilis]|uniref:hypothetical protein n=1 Tax=Gemmiger formicilis TaxID=745368 RepID=UPI0039940595